MPDFLLPDLGEGLTEAEVVAWHVQPGDHVTVDQVIAEVETAKAVVEVPVPFAGTVATLHADAGTVVNVGQPLLTVTADNAGGDPAPRTSTPAPSGTADGPKPDGTEESSGSVLIGYGTTAAPPRRRRGLRRGTTPAPTRPLITSAASAAPSPATRPERSGPVPVISPLVRKLARDAGLDLASLPGSGPEGLVTRADVRQAIGVRTAAPGRTVEPGPVPAPAVPAEAEERRIPLRGARRAVADKLARARREIPEATVWVDVDATGMVEARRELNARSPGQPVSLLALLARFTLLGLRRYPALNARIEDDEIVLPAAVNLGFAAQTEHGLVVPVVHDAGRLSTRELSARLAERTTAARERRLSPADLAGGTFTVNNYGVFGVDGSAAIINHPEVAILGMGRVIDRPWVAGGQLAVRKVTELTLSFDHRACDGGVAGGFLRYVADCIESPVGALGDL